MVYLYLIGFPVFALVLLALLSILGGGLLGGIIGAVGGSVRGWEDPSGDRRALRFYKGLACGIWLGALLGLLGVVVLFMSLHTLP
jgi:hypothetical protein